MATQAWRDANHEQEKKSRREWYARNSEHAIAKVMARKKELLEWIRSIKSQLSCIECHEDHVACLDFHHPDPSEKEGNVASLVARGWSKERILLEISKCIILCSNCHRKLHYDERQED